MNATHRTILMRDRFEFAAAHRLHCAEQSDAWNRETFGKCNNPAGHGHNYELEVLVATQVDEAGVPALSIDRLEEIVDTEVIQHLDHRHLNEDCPQFAEMNPSVENITITCHQMLEGPIAAASGALHSVTVWETSKTSCTFPAQ